MTPAASSIASDTRVSYRRGLRIDHTASRSGRRRAASEVIRRAVLNPAGDNEGGFLDPLRDVVASGKTPADRLLDKFHGEWGGDAPAAKRTTAEPHDERRTRRGQESP